MENQLHKVYSKHIEGDVYMDSSYQLKIGEFPNAQVIPGVIIYFSKKLNLNQKSVLAHLHLNKQIDTSKFDELFAEEGWDVHTKSRT